jgi:PAS domain-containing protein
MVRADVNTRSVRENHCKTGEDLKLQVLREIEERYRTLFETMVLGVVYQDIDGKIISANPAAEQILGLSIDQMQGRTSTDPMWKSIHEDGSDFPGESHPAMVDLKNWKNYRKCNNGCF